MATETRNGADMQRILNVAGRLGDIFAFVRGGGNLEAREAEAMFIRATLEALQEPTISQLVFKNGDFRPIRKLAKTGYRVDEPEIGFLNKDGVISLAVRINTMDMFGREDRLDGLKDEVRIMLPNYPLQTWGRPEMVHNEYGNGGDYLHYTRPLTVDEILLDRPAFTDYVDGLNAICDELTPHFGEEMLAPKNDPKVVKFVRGLKKGTQIVADKLHEYRSAIKK